LDEEKAFYEDEAITDQYHDSVNLVHQSTFQEKDNITVIEIAEKLS